jgi:hypothetical protein
LVIVGVSLFYIAATWSFRVEPRPTRDLLTELNSPWSHIPAHQRAATTYIEVSAAWSRSRPPRPLGSTANFLANRPNDPEYSEIVRIVRSLEPLLAEARAASKLEHLGADFVPADNERLSHNAGYLVESTSATAAVNLEIPGLYAASECISLLTFDSISASQENDHARLAANVRSILGIAKQCRQIETITSDYISMYAVQSAALQIRRSLHTSPSALSTITLQEISRDLQTTSQMSRLRFESERVMLTDLLDRTFTPGPTGRITAAGVRRMDTIGRRATNIVRGTIPEETHFLAAFKAHQIGTRAEHLEWLEAMIEEAEIARNAGPAGLERLLAYESANMDDNPSLLTRLPIAIMTSPAFGHAISLEFKMDLETSATRVVIAIELYRRQHGALPESLGQLVPDFIDEIPSDPFDTVGGPIKYLPSADSFYLYFNGADLKDDGATPPPPDMHRRIQLLNQLTVPAFPDLSGDWILHPPQD